MTPERIESDTGSEAEAPAQSAPEGANSAPSAPDLAITQADRTLESLSLHEKLTRANAELSTRKRNGKQTKISQIVDWLLSNNTDILPQEVIAQIMGEGKIAPRTRLKIAGIQNKTFQRVNISLRRDTKGSIKVVSSNPHHQKWKDKQSKPTNAQQIPLTPPPTSASKTQNTRLSHAEPSIETTAQLRQVSLATRDEIHSALMKILDTPRSRNTALGIRRADGTKVSTQAYFLETFLKANPIPQEELEKGFPSKRQLSAARSNTNNNPHSVIREQALKIFTDHNFRQPEKSEWRIESTRVQSSNNPQEEEANKIYANAKQIKETPSIFSNAPQVSQFIFGALTDLKMGATLEEFSVVTGLTEEAIMEAVNHINTSVIPEGIDLKIHNRNGVLIFGTRPAVILLNTPKTRTATIDWKTAIHATRKRIANTEAIELEPDTKVAESEAQLVTKVIRLEPSPEKPAKEKLHTEEAPKDTPIILTKIIENYRTSESSKKVLKALMENSEGIPAATITRIIQESGIQSPLPNFIFNINRALRKHGLILMLDKNTGIVKVKRIKQNIDEPATAQEQTTAEPAELRKTAPAPAQSLLLKVETLTEIIKTKDLELRKLNEELTQSAELRNRVRAITARDAKHDARIEITAEFERQIEKLKRKISDLEKEIRGLNAAQIKTLRLFQRENLTNPQATENISALTLEAARLRRKIIELTTRATEASANAQPVNVIELRAELEQAKARTTASAKSLADAEKRLNSANEEIAEQDEQIANLEKDKAYLQATLTHETAQAKPELTEDTKRTIANLRAEVERHRRERIASDLLSQRIQTLEAETAKLRAQLQGRSGKKKIPSKSVGHSYKIPISIPPALTDQGHRFEPQPTSTQPKTPAPSENTQTMTVSNIGNFTFDNIFTLRNSIISALRTLGENLTLDNIRTLKASLESVHEDPSTKAFHKPIIMKYLEVLQRKLDLIPNTNNGRNILSQNEYTKLIVAATNTLV